MYDAQQKNAENSENQPRATCSPSSPSPEAERQLAEIEERQAFAFWESRLSELKAMETKERKRIRHPDVTREYGHYIFQGDDLAHVPARYRTASIFDLAGPPGYSNALDAIKRLYPMADGFSLAGRDFIEGGIVALVGARGTGKTHMACALVNLFNVLAYSPNDEGYTVLTRNFAMYRRAADMFCELKSTFGGKGGTTAEQLVGKWIKASLLVIDEVQERSESQWENTVLTNVIDRRYGALRPTILISNLSPEAFITHLGESAVSRLTEVGQFIVADWPSFRLATAAARQAVA